MTVLRSEQNKSYDSGGIRTHATEVTGALNQRLRPLGHAILALSEKNLGVVMTTKNDHKK